MRKLGGSNLRGDLRREAILGGGEQSVPLVGGFKDSISFKGEGGGGR